MASVLNLNNEVVKMRKDVKKVKVLIIRKLTRHISQLRSKKGPEELIQKNQRRVQRLIEEVQSIKKLKPDDVTKTALLNEIDFEKECKKPNSTMETRAIARLASHPLLRQKVSSIKDAIKAFKEARKISAEQEAKNEDTTKVSDHTENVSKNTKKPHIRETARKISAEQEAKNEDTKSSDHTANMSKNTKKPLKQETARKISAEQEDKNEDTKVSDQTANLSKDTKKPHKKEIAKKKQKTKNTKPENGTSDNLLCKTMHKGNPPVSSIQRHEEANLGSPKSGQLPASLIVPIVKTEEKLEHDVPEKKILEKISENDSKPEKKMPPKHISGSESSDIEDSDIEDKEYFDDSTEERFLKKGSDFAESDSESEDDFFIGKVSQTKKKSNKNSSKNKVKKETLPIENTRPTTAGSTTGQKGNTVPKTVKLESVFCDSLSHPKQKSSFLKSEAKLQPAWNKKAVVPQGNKFTKKPQPARSTAVKMQSKPEPALHPSWEASRKRKEQTQIAAFQGKKIVFDD